MRWGNPTLTALIGLGIVNHIVLTGSRVTVTLEALRLGASAAVVGLLLAVFALLPMVLSVAAGRLSDRIGVRKPMLAGSCAMALGAAVPMVVPGLAGLFITAAVLGTALMLFQVPAQNATGELGPPSDRAHNFSLLALGYAVSTLLGPLIAGFTIDHGGYVATFAVFAALPLIPVAVLARGALALPGPHPAHVQGHTGGALALLRHEKLRPVFVINVMLAVAWDLHTIVIPVYGAHIGLSASQIGVILASFGAATFVVRFSMRWVVTRVDERQVLTVALLSAGAVYALFPFCHSASALTALSFGLGLGVGASQPMVMSLLHAYAPPGRMGEAAGVRMSLVQSMAVAVPLTFGALSAAIGLTPVFWSVGAGLAAGGYFTRPRGK
ncbi:MAG: MFS transporter [Burkholderiales bacterium]|nr:MFS transporter [Burkholderiales bacterium]